MSDVVAELSHAYDAVSDANGDLPTDHHKAHYRHVEILRSVARWTTPTALLDIGAGYAVESHVLAGRGYSPTIMDTTDAGSGFVERFSALGWPTVDANVERGIPLPDESFGLVLFLDVLEHLRDSPRQPLADIMRVLKPGGIVVVVTPNIIELRKRLYMLTGHSFMPDLSYIWNTRYHAEHHREYTPGEVWTVMEWAGFEVVEARTVDTFWPLSLRKWRGLGRGRGAMGGNSVLSSFSINGSWTNPYDWAKMPARALVRAIPSLRDTIIIVGRKP